jgi:hypothetical protein
MPCIRIGSALVNVGNPTETVIMKSGRKLSVEWHDYFGPSVVGRRGLRCLTNAEFKDPNVDAWIVGHGGKSGIEDDGPILPRPRKRPAETFDPNRPVTAKVFHKAAFIDREGNASALCFRKPHAVNLSRETAVLVDENVTCEACLALLEKNSCTQDRHGLA